jgi:diguanylate cyclase (GGDEF)-like protein
VISAPLPRNEVSRLSVLRATGLMGAPDDHSLDCATHIAASLFNVPFATVSLVDAKRQLFRSSVGWDLTEAPRELSFCAHVVANGLSLVVEDTLRDVRFADSPLVLGPPHIRFYAGHPIRAKTGEVLGTLCILDTRPREFSGTQQNLLRELASMVESAIDTTETNQLQRKLAVGPGTEVIESRLDPLLRIWDRRAIISLLERRSRAPLRNNPTSVLMVALDGITRINDCYGRETGDQVLKAASKVLRSILRWPNEIGRFGGNEFLVVLPQKSGADAESLARRVRDSMSLISIDPAGPAPRAETIGSTVSIAVQEWQLTTGESLEDLLNRAGTTLLCAKRRGGNSVLLGKGNRPYAVSARYVS